MAVVNGTRGMWGGHFQLVEELVEVLVLLLETRKVNRLTRRRRDVPLTY
jgi:hypothetical protein